MPLAEVPSRIAVVLERLRQRVVLGVEPRDGTGNRRKPVRRTTLGGNRFQNDFGQVTRRRRDAMTGGAEARENAGPRRRTQWTG